MQSLHYQQFLTETSRALTSPTSREEYAELIDLLTKRYNTDFDLQETLGYIDRFLEKSDLVEAWNWRSIILSHHGEPESIEMALECIDQEVRGGGGASVLLAVKSIELN